jgi:hypothetical protein
MIQGQAGQPPVLAGVDTQSLRGGLRRRPNGPVCEDHAFRRSGRPAGRHHQGVTRFDRYPVGTELVATRPDHPGRAEVFEYGLLGRPGQALIEREYRIAAVPRRAEGPDELGAAGQVDCDEVPHDS